MITLTDGERMHPLWLKIEKHLTDRLATLRAKNDDPKLTAEQTQALRGQIAEVKAFIALGAKQPTIE